MASDPGSGPHEDLDAVLAAATWVRVVLGGDFDHRHRRANENVAVERDQEAIESLRVALRIKRESLLLKAAWMTPGDLTFGFFSGDGDFLTSVTYLHPGWLRWTGWGYDAEASDPDGLLRWLAQRGWEPTDA
jgi:hypothetical protein